MLKNTLAVSLLALGLGLAPAQAQIFGPSDDEKAHEAAQDSHLADLDHQLQQAQSRIGSLQDKVNNLTDSLSRATGANEDLGHQIQVQNDKIDKMQKDFAYRLCTVSAQQLGADGQGLNCAAGGASGGGAAYAPPQGGMRPGDSLPPIGNDPNQGFSRSPSTIDASGNGQGSDQFGGPNPGNSQVRGRGPGTLGTLPATPYDRMAPNGPPQQDSAVGSSGSNPRQYDTAMNLLAKAQYDEAAAAFQAYADTYPDDTDLAPQALYWVGNISYVRQDYAPAQRKFAEVIKKYPKAGRAPDAMLKLAQSFLALGQKSEGCTTLGLFKSRYPNAPDATLQAAAGLRKTACAK